MKKTEFNNPFNVSYRIIKWIINRIFRPDIKDGYYSILIPTSHDFH